MATIINAATPNTSAGPATSTVALNTTGGSGTCFLGFVMSRSPNITPSDTFGNTWTPLIAEQTVTLDSIDYFCRVWICVGGTGGNNHQFTATNDASGALDFITAHFIELVGDVVGLDEVSDWVVDGTADYESDVLDPSAPNALIFAFNQIFSTTAGSSFTHGDDGFADVASAYLNGVNGPVGEIRYQFGGAPDSYQTIITATNPSPRDVGAFLFSIELASGVPVARSVVLALEPGVASGAAVQASTARTRAAAFLPLVGAGAIAQPQVAGTVARAFPPEVVMGFSVPAAVTRSIALEPEVAGGAAAFPPVARSLARGFDPAAGTGVLVAPLYGATVQNALAPTVAVSVAARPAAARTAALASDPVVAAGANVSAPAARAAVAAFDPAVLASVGVEVDVPVALSRVLTRPPVAYVDDGLPAIAEILVLWGRSASIRIMSSMKTINERTSSAVRVAFRDMDRKPITPLAVEYRIDDEAGVTIRDWSSTPADQELTIEVSDEDNRILNPTRPFETRIMTVRASYGPGKGASEEYRWRVRNLRFQS